MSERINKYLSSHGVCSRREADRLLSLGRITVDGRTALMGELVSDDNIICVDGKRVDAQAPDEIIIAFNKPVGIVCTTTDKQGDNSIVDFIGHKQRIYPIGRLDKDSCGLILLTNNGDITDRILRSVNGHEKEYIVTVDKNIDKSFVDAMKKGVYLKELDRTTKECTVEKISSKVFRIVLTQGLNRQIRRMCETLGYKVVKLKRVRIMNVLLGDLKVGEYRDLEESEKEELFKNIYS